MPSHLHGRSALGIDSRRHGLSPADNATLAIMSVSVIVLGVAAARGASVTGDLLLHAGLLLAYAVVAAALVRYGRGQRAVVIRGVIVVAAMFTLYATLGHVAFAAIPWIADPALAAADRMLLAGRSPSLLVDPLVTPTIVEVLSFFYGAFIPYLYVSIFLGLVSRAPAERELFITGFALLYATSFLGYLLLPARGPIVELSAAYGAPLSGGRFYALVVETIDRMGGPHGAFPSLHLGATLYMLIFDLRHGDSLRGLVYVPLAALIGVATVALRYHYVIDLLAGIALAALAVYAAGGIALRRAAAAATSVHP
jgi:membrane-associated phospholipid phosphatase